MPKKTEKPKGKTRKKLFSFKGEDGRRYNLTLRQKLFSEYYLALRGNGVEAVIKAGYRGTKYNRKLAAVIASENLIKPNIFAYINFRLSEFGFEDENVRKQHLFLLNQFADLRMKAKAIDMFYKLRGEYAPEKLEHGVNKELNEALDRMSKILPE